MNKISLFFVGATVGILLIAIILGITELTYKGGQIDCINGDIKFVLVLQPDNTVEWESIDN